MAEVKMIADRKHEAFNCNGRAHSIIQAGEPFTCDDPENFISGGVLDAAENDNSGAESADDWSAA